MNSHFLRWYGAYVVVIVFCASSATMPFFIKERWNAGIFYCSEHPEAKHLKTAKASAYFPERTPPDKDFEFIPGHAKKAKCLGRPKKVVQEPDGENKQFEFVPVTKDSIIIK